MTQNLKSIDKYSKGNEYLCISSSDGWAVPGRIPQGVIYDQSGENHWQEGNGNIIVLDGIIIKM